MSHLDERCALSTGKEPETERGGGGSSGGEAAPDASRRALLGKTAPETRTYQLQNKSDVCKLGD